MSLRHTARGVGGGECLDAPVSLVRHRAEAGRDRVDAALAGVPGTGPGSRPLASGNATTKPCPSVCARAAARDTAVGRNGTLRTVAVVIASLAARRAPRRSKHPG